MYAALIFRRCKNPIEKYCFAAKTNHMATTSQHNGLAPFSKEHSNFYARHFFETFSLISLVFYGQTMWWLDLLKNMYFETFWVRERS